MKYKVVVFGVKDTSANIIEFIHNTISITIIRTSPHM